MSSLIPKISIGRDTKKGNHFDLSSLTHTTSEIGYVQPTFSKNLVPNSSVRVGTRTGVRLSPLFVPTMGQLDVRHYHCFVPFSTLWTPFDAFLTKTNYTLPDGTTYQPSVIPYFNLRGLLTTIFGNTGFDGDQYANVEKMRRDLICTVYTRSSAGSYSRLTGTQLMALSAQDLFLDSELPYYPQNIIQPDSNGVEHVYYCGNSYQIMDDDEADSLIPEMPIPTIAHNDFCVHTTITSGNTTKTYILCYNFSGCLKRLRTIFMGLGYSFNPFDDNAVTILKLLAFYKSYWMLFGVNRTFNFFNTACYKLIKNTSDNSYTELTINGTPYAYAYLIQLVCDLCDCTYTCPVDYFSSADVVTGRGNNGITSVSSLVKFTNGQEMSVGAIASNDGSPTTTASNDDTYSGAIFPLAQKIAMRLLRFVNKNSVVGRQISEILRTRYGVNDIHNTTHEDVIKVGASSVPIQISAVYNNAEVGDMPLGAYAGIGIGSHRSKNFKFHTDEFGTFITLTAVVPKMGYFQGMYKENSDGVSGSLDFYTPEFDAIGWQSVDYSELVADRQHMLYENSSVGTNLGVFGYAPFYQHMKVSFNRCLGDISIPHLRESMLPYTLDRFFPDYHLSPNGTPSDDLLPVNDPQTFRSGTQGNTNRIFSDVSKTDDHVIMQIFFDIKMSAPMKSIATSYDTWDEESTQSVDVAHE